MRTIPSLSLSHSLSRIFFFFSRLLAIKNYQQQQELCVQVDREERAIGDDEAEAEAEDDSDCVGVSVSVSLLIALYSTLLLLLFSHSSPTSLPR